MIYEEVSGSIFDYKDDYILLLPISADFFTLDSWFTKKYMDENPQLFRTYNFEGETFYPAFFPVNDDGKHIFNIVVKKICYKPAEYKVTKRSFERLAEYIRNEYIRNPDHGPYKLVISNRMWSSGDLDWQKVLDLLKNFDDLDGEILIVKEKTED